jgi:CRISPR-associated protein Csb2
MIAIGIRYLCGYSAATNPATQRPEWPVHEGRVFMALTSAHHEYGAAAGERAALEWVEAAGAPAFYAGTSFERSPVKAYVPVNDSSGNIVDRSRQDRMFPKAWLENDTVYLVWENEPAPDIRESLKGLCPKVTRLGHSSSLVQMWVVEQGEEPVPNWIPSEIGELRMRVSSPGTLRTLEEAFNAEGFERFDRLNQELEQAKGKTRTALKKQIDTEFPEGSPSYRRPQIARWQGYALGSPAVDGKPSVAGPFDSDILILAKQEGRTLGLESTLQLTGALRIAAMKAATRLSGPTGPPEWLSGHAPDGSPSLRPHAAFFPLPYVGAEHSDGHVMGLALAIPREFETDSRESREEAIRNALGGLFFDLESGLERSIRLWRNDLCWEWQLQRENRERPPVALKAITWTRESRIWESVTPLVLHHYPKKSRPDDVEEIVREAFASALFPEPEEVRIRSVSAVNGVGHARDIPPFDEGGPGMCRYQTHVVVRFREKVLGPVLVGRGRYRGYGLFRPCAEEREGTGAN